MAAYENYEYNMDLIEDMFRYIAINAFGKTQFNVRGHVIALQPCDLRMSFNGLHGLVIDHLAGF